MTTIAKTIFQQIKALDPFAFYAWGAFRQPVTFYDKGLKFKTGGLAKFKGYVLVEYDEGNDLYNVIFAKLRKAVWKEIERVEGVYFDQLVEVIDTRVQ